VIEECRPTHPRLLRRRRRNTGHRLRGSTVDDAVTTASLGQRSIVVRRMTTSRGKETTTKTAVPSTRGTPPILRPSHRRSLLPLMLSLLVVVLVFVVLLPSSDGVDYGPDVVEGSINNPLNQYCGVNLEEAHRFCHLPVNESFPCPNGDADCPYNLPCWTLEEPCTMPPTPGPTPTPTVSSLPMITATIMPTDSPPPTFSPPTWSPITAISADPRDHYFCGLGFDNLFDW
jgi:hypothetical protein